MKARTLLASLALAWFAVASATPVAKKYTPEIHGQIRSAGAAAATNVCLRQSGSEIRNCGYADADGRFFIPSSGPLHSAQAKSDGEPGADDAPPTYWLETGNVLKPQKLWPIEPSLDRHAAIDLDCDLARAGSADYRDCASKPSRPYVVDVPRDPTPYMMVWPKKPAN